MRYKIIGDSCCDYTEDFDGLSWLARVPLTIELDGLRKADDESFNCLEFLGKMAASSSAPTSACPSPGDFLESIDCGADDVYVVTLSDKLSGSYNSAVIAAEMYRETHPEKNVHIFNSLSAAACQIAICLKLRELAEAGGRFDDIVSRTELFIKESTTLFVLETLDVFRKSGRLNHLQAIITGALKLKLLMGADGEGNVCVKGKSLSHSGAIAKMVAMVKSKCEKLAPLERIFVLTECNCRELAERVRDEVMAACPFARAVICRAGGISTIYANSGGLIAAF